MTVLTQDLERRIFDVLGLGDRTSALSRAKIAIQQIDAVTYETTQQIQAEVDANLHPLELLPIPTLDKYTEEYVNVDEVTLLKEVSYTPPQREALGKFFRSRHDEQQKRNAIERAKAQRIRGYTNHLTKIGEGNEERRQDYDAQRQREIMAKGHSKEGLYQDAEFFLNDVVNQKPFDFAGSQHAPEPDAFISTDVPEAGFLKDYIGFKQLAGSKDANKLEQASYHIDSMVKFMQNSAHYGLRQLAGIMKEFKVPLALEQVSVLIDAHQYNLAIEIASRVNDASPNGQALYLRGEAYLRLGNFNRAAVEFREAYSLNPNRPDIDTKIIEVFKGQIALGRVNRAVSGLDLMIKASKRTTIPFTVERKDNLLVEQTKALEQSGNYELAYQVAGGVENSEKRDALLIGQATDLTKNKNYDLASRVADSVKDQNRKSELMADQARALMEDQRYDAAYGAAVKVQGPAQASYLKGEIRFRQGSATNSKELYEEASVQFRNAFIQDPKIQGLAVKIADASGTLAAFVENPTIDITQINPEVAAKYKEAVQRYGHGLITDRSDGTAGAKKLFETVLESLGYTQVAVAAQTASAEQASGIQDLLQGAKQDIAERTKHLNEGERLLLAKALHYMANISRLNVDIRAATGLNPDNPSQLGYIEQSLAVLPTKNAYVFLAETLRAK